MDEHMTGIQIDMRNLGKGFILSQSCAPVYSEAATRGQSGAVSGGGSV